VPAIGRAGAEYSPKGSDPMSTASARHGLLRRVVVVITLLGLYSGCSGAGGKSGGKVTLSATVFGDRRVPSAPSMPGGVTVTLDYDCDCFKSRLASHPSAASVVNYEFNDASKSTPNGQSLPPDLANMGLQYATGDTAGLERSLVERKCVKQGFRFAECAK
jgi:hypothetical protein